MLIGGVDYPIEEGVLVIVLAASIIFTTFLFYRGNYSYTIKYELMRKHLFFRKNQIALLLVDFTYKAFFILPFLIILTLAILRGLKNTLEFMPILVNGLIVLLILYPNKRQYYYVKNLAIWLFAIVAQLVALFLADDVSNRYAELSTIFYCANSMLFSLAILSTSRVYWDISKAMKICGQMVQQVNEEWCIKPEPRLPKIFDGGLYGWLCGAKSFVTFMILYLLSLVMLGVYGYLILLLQGTYLGFVNGFVIVMFDLFIFLLSQGRSSVRTIMIIIFSSRLLSFIFGANYWLVGYCLLYCAIGFYIGTIIIEKRLPLHQGNKQYRHYVNLFRTPQCSLAFLTIIIVVMIIIQLYALKSNVQVGLQGIGIPLWQLAILLIVATWVAILYLASLKMLQRIKNKVNVKTNFYYGFRFVGSYHICLLSIYTLVVGLGLYWYFYLKDTNFLIIAIFLPILFITLFNAYGSWVQNDYQVLIDINQYNTKMERKYDMKLKKINIIRKRRQNKTVKTTTILNKTNQKLDKSHLKNKQIKEEMCSGIMYQKSQIALVKQNSIDHHQSYCQQSQLKRQQQSKIKQSTSFYGILSQNYFDINDDEQTLKLQQFQRLQDWRCNQNISFFKTWSYLTPNDKKIIINLGIFCLLIIGFVLCSYLWSQSSIGLQISISLLSYLSLLMFFRSIKCGSSFKLLQLVICGLGLVMGLIYWSFFYYQVQRALSWAALFIILITGLIYIAIGDKNNRILMIFLIIETSILLAFILILVGINFSYEVVFVTGLLMILAGLGAVNYYYFIRLDGHIPFVLRIITGVMILLVVGGITAGGLVLNAISNFIIFTVVMGVLQLVLLGLSIAMLIRKVTNLYDRPHVYCAYQYPIYRFDSDREVLVSSSRHKIIFSAAMIVLVVYSAVVSIIFVKKWMAVYSMGGFLVLNFIVLVMISMGTYYNIARKKNKLTRQLIIDTFNLLKDKYMIGETEGEDSPYFERELQRAKVHAEEVNTQGAWKQVVRLHDQVVKNQEQQEKFLFFWLALIQFQLNTRTRAKHIQFINEIKECQQQLIDNGILIQSINQVLTIENKYKTLKREINSLPPLENVIFQEIIEMHQSEKSSKKLQLTALHQKQQQSNNIRDDQLFQKLQKQGGSQAKIAEFNELVKKLGRKGIFTDEQFPPNENVLGQLASRVDSWRRPAIGEVLIKDGITANDVKQGEIGDCYLISSFAVLGQQRIKDALGVRSDGKQIWSNNKGAYMVKFYKFLKEVYVIIDDQMPVNDQQEWVFAKCQDPNQFWPGILQKAYAKLYSGYDKIIQGKCHRVLAEFTGGFPFQVLLQEYKNNPNGLWCKITNGKKNGYLLAAGSPSHPVGDAAFSKRGIVQGHAYSVLQSQQVEGYKLIKLKNPHGSAGKQWIGDFSDNSELMTKRLMNLLGHTQLEDGIFWMSLEDFIYEFKSLYICAVFNQNWNKIQPVEAEWTPLNSYGTPNLSADTFKNPNYGIKTTKKSTVFINLTQQAVSALKGRNYIYMRVQRNEGERIKRQDLSSQKLCGTPIRPINAVSISTQIELQAQSYPYTFTLVVTCKNEGDTGKYTLQIYCSDENAELIDDKQFDPY